jgi:hypothetical protein
VRVARTGRRAMLIEGSERGCGNHEEGLTIMISSSSKIRGTCPSCGLRVESLSCRDVRVDDDDSDTPWGTVSL